jgi:DEAD/DEAH box helicase domain-containing protein
MRAFNWSTDAQRDRMDAILRAAWNELVQLKLLGVSDSGYKLRLEDASFRLISKAAICPITRKLLDTAFEGLTPYTSPKNPDATCKVSWVDIPRFPYPFGGDADGRQRIELAREWLANESGVQVLREEGLWTDLADRIVEGGAYFRAAEHSAQQNRTTLERYEDDFKAGKLNLMSCSTTMEMGVDIGGISVVAMNNVPPHPANYLQRAGRAGRRREARAVALTVCKNTPHDQGVFDQPTWPFTSHIAVPAVSLQSPELIIRHVNSWLLACWLKRIVKQEEIRKMTCGAFFIPVGDWSVSDRFLAWCQHPEANLTSELRQDLARLVINTPLASQTAEQLVRSTLERMAEVAAAWRSQHESVSQQRAVFAGDKASSNKALQALNIQIERLEGEYLLSELANRRFLPGYGFPTDVVSLDHRNRGSRIDGEQEAGDKREDNRARRLQLPSRDRATALREYAPGAEIVLDGLVYRSAGVTLNWHIPTSEEDIKKEAQLLKFAWRCHHCGASGSEIGQRPEVCLEPDCGNELRDDHIHQYLVPSGFAVDFFVTPHNDFSSQVYVPVKQPWLAVRGGWSALANPSAGRFRSNSLAHLYHYSAGANGCGYALCLECGRAEPMLSRPDPETHSSLPEAFRKPHRRLRGDREDKTGSRMCRGSDDSWKIKQGIVLGHDTTTDALELILRTPEGSLLNDETIAFTLAVAMRMAIAESLGVMADELGCATRALWLEGQEARVIQVFDMRSGGYSVLAAPQLLDRSFWELVRRQLECHAKCASACPHCLLSFDTRFAAEHLDRHKALDLLTPQWLAQYQLAPELTIFGPNTQPESAPLLGAIERTLLRADANSVRLYLQGDATHWDLPGAHALGAAMLGWKVRGLDIELCARQGTLSTLTEENRCKLASLLELGIRYYELPASEMVAGNSPLPLLAAVCQTNVWHGWASNSHSMGLPNEGWGMSVEDSLLLHGACSLPAGHNPVPKEDVRPKTGDLELDIRTELDGKIELFGQSFWQLLCEKSPVLAKLLEQDEMSLVSYSDRYLKSPLPVSLLLSVLNGLTKYPAVSGGRRECVVRSVPFQNERGSGHAIWHDWADSEKRDEILTGALAYLGYEGRVMSEKEISHGRLLEITFVSGKHARIRLDQGLSFWFASRDIQQRPRAYPFQETNERQVDLLVNSFGAIEAPRIVSTQFFIRIN